MTKLVFQNFPFKLAVAILFPLTAPAQNLDQIGVTLLRAVTTNLNGAGVRVAQVEASQSTNSPIWEVNPANGSVAQPATLFTYFSSAGSTNNFPNALGSESGHADSVAGNFYGSPAGVATNLAHVDNFEADDFYDLISAPLPASIGDAVVNQSFTFGAQSASEQEAVDSQYDNYAARFKILFVSAVDNAGNVHAPGTSYNGIGVGDSDGYSSLGPTIDNGRAKPDLTAPGGATSFSTPYVAGAATILLQAALRGDGGSDTNSAADIRTIKSLLLNGAIKPVGWTNDPPSPLDAHYGAGILNVFNSCQQLAGGKNNFISATTVSTGGAHPPNGANGAITNLSGWDFNTISSTAGGLFSTASDGANHYFFNVSNNFPNAIFAATATLVWNRQQNQNDINNLDLFLYNCANSNLVACSTSLVDNVEHIYLPRLAPGRYDLQVLKHGGSFVSASETYALAWEFFSETLRAQKIGSAVALTFPIYPAGFLVETATNLLPPINWQTNLPPPILTNGQNYVFLKATNSAEFFRLREPNF